MATNTETLHTVVNFSNSNGTEELSQTVPSGEYWYVDNISLEGRGNGVNDLGSVSICIASADRQSTVGNSLFNGYGNPNAGRSKSVQIERNDALMSSKTDVDHYADGGDEIAVGISNNSCGGTADVTVTMRRVL